MSTTLLGFPDFGGIDDGGHVGMPSVTLVAEDIAPVNVAVVDADDVSVDDSDGDKQPLGWRVQ